MLAKLVHECGVARRVPRLDIQINPSQRNNDQKAIISATDTVWENRERASKMHVPIEDNVPKRSFRPRAAQEHVPYHVRELLGFGVVGEADLGDLAAETDADRCSARLALLDLGRHGRATRRLSLLIGSGAAVARHRAGLSQTHQPQNTAQSQGRRAGLDS